ncbi:MAG: hypothetical protein Q7R43_06195 [Candidatus Daviesbacteria bacterium]|nr:hypothetical protein [Candidatus Daviesbacteria bacterium]
MTEKLPENYEQDLKKFEDQQENYIGYLQELSQLQQKTKSIRHELNQNLERLKNLRYKILYQLLEEKKLGVCSAEIFPDEFILQHDRIKNPSKLALLGIFPTSQLRFLYFFDIRWSSGSHYESGNSYSIEHILRLCPHHFPQDLPKFPPAVFYHSKINEDRLESHPFYFEVIKKEPNRFIHKTTLIDTPGPYHQSPLPEKIFQHFKITAIPKLPQEPR